MKYVGGVDVLQSPQDLVDEVFVVSNSELLSRGDDLVQISVHEIRHNVQGVEMLLIWRRRQNVFQAEDVLVMKVPQQLDFAQRALRILQVLKGIGNLLDSNGLACL